MVISEAHKFVFVSTPKAATNTMYRVLEGYYQAVPLNACGGFHCNRVPWKYHGFFIFTCVRNPYSRAVSAWASSCEGYSWSPICQQGFLPFLQWLVMHKSVPPTAAMLKPQCMWLEPVERLDAILKLETLDEDVKALPFWAGPDKLPRMNSTLGPGRPDKFDWVKPWREYMTPEAVELIHAWAGDDFEQYGYEREFAHDPAH